MPESNKPTQFTPSKKTLTVFSLVMINIIAVDNLRSLPFSAEYGFSLIFFYLLATVMFLIPIALVATELASGWARRGGLYVWIREAFGTKFGFFIIWLQWIYNIVWYPTILAFLAGALSYLINPQLTQNKTYMLTMILSLFWGSTLLNCFGMKLSSVVSSIGAIIGTLLPMALIIGLGSWWIYQGNPLSITPSWHNLLPDLSNMGNFSFLVAILFGLIGIEMSSVHADDVENPERAYPKAILISAIIIVSSLILSSLAIAFVVPKEKLSVVNGLNQAFQIFFHAYHIDWMENLMVILIVIGGISGVAAWVIGPTKGLLVAARDAHLPPFLTKTNKYQVPVPLLILQGIICTILSCVFLLMPSVSSSYWLLTAMTAQLSLIVYIGLFATGLRLRYKQPEVERTFLVPGGKLGLWLVCSLGLLSCIVTIAFGFIPPAQLSIGNPRTYEALLIGGILLLALPPLFVAKKQ